MLQSFTFWTSVLVVLIVYLCLSVGLRWLREERACARGERHYPPGSAFDVSTISPRVSACAGIMLRHYIPVAACFSPTTTDCRSSKDGDELFVFSPCEMRG